MPENTFHDPESSADIDLRFDYHPPATSDVANDHECARAIVKAVAHWVDANIPPGREKALALTKLKEALFWANAAIARFGHYDHVHVNPDVAQQNSEGVTEDDE